MQRNFKNRKQRDVMKYPRGIDGTEVVISPSSTVTMVYTDSTLNRNNAGSKYLVFRFRANGLYDPDPSLGSGSISGFAEYRGFYAKYLVEKVEVTWRVSNQESFPINVVSGYSESDPGIVLTTPSQVLDMAELPFVKTAELSAIGGQDRTVVRYLLDLSTCYGNRGEYLNSTAFAGFGNANPGNILYVFFAVASSTNLVNGINSMLTVRFKTRWYTRTPILDRYLKDRTVPEKMEIDESSCSECGGFHC